MNKYLDILNIIKDNDYIICNNGVLENNTHNLKTLTFTNDMNIILLNKYDQDTTLDILISSDVKVSIIEINCFQSSATVNKNIIVEDNAVLKFLSIDLNMQELNIVNTVNTITNISKNAYIDNMKLSIMDNQLNQFVNTNLNGEKSSLIDFYVLINTSKKSQLFDMLVNHKAKKTTSEMKNFGICMNDSVLDINTNGHVFKDATSSSVNQKSKGILLDELCQISCNPLLQIDEYDCNASHGAGIGAIDREELYYLMSRGLKEIDSIELIIDGFVNPIYERISEVSEELKDYIKECVKKQMN